MTAAEFHQQQLEQQQQEELPVTTRDLDNIAYRCLGAAQALRDIKKIKGDLYRAITIEQSLVELVNQYEILRRKYNEQNRISH